MRILHVTYIYPPRPEVADGITNVAYSVTKELARRGHEVTVFTSNLMDLHSSKQLSVGRYTINGVEVFYSRSLCRYKTFMVTPSLIRHLLKNMYDFDIIHIHDSRSFQGISAYLVGEIKSVPYIFQPHGSYLSPLPDSFLTKTARLALDKLISQQIFKKASKIIALSRVEAERYRSMGVPEEKIAIIPNGIDLSGYANLPPKGQFKRKFNIPEDRKMVLYLGRIHKIKGIDFLVKAYAYLTKKMNFKGAVLVIAGPDDGYLNEVKRLVSSLNLANKIVFTGMLTEKEKISAYMDSNVVVNVEPSNVFGLVPLEAAACSKPVIVSRDNAISEIIHKGNFGFSVNYGDITALAKIMETILRDEDLTNEMGRRGREYVFANFDWSKIVAKLEKVYEEVVNS